MIPLSDDGPPLRRLPWVTVLLLTLNAGVFVVSGSGSTLGLFPYALVPGNLTGRNPVKLVLVRVDLVRRGVALRSEEFVERVPATFDEGSDDGKRWLSREYRVPGVRLAVAAHAVSPAVPAFLTLLTSMFLHGGLSHLLGNMIFLYVFGRRLEDGLGSFGLLAFYLAVGILAGLGHVAVDPSDPTPTVGASGAISGLLGGYFLLWPRRRIMTLVPIWPLPLTWPIPVPIFVLVWVGFQVVILKTPGSNVAVWAHLVGFLYGMALVRFLGPRNIRRRETPLPRVVRWPGRDPHRDRPTDLY